VDKPKYQYLQALRFVAALLVVYAHAIDTSQALTGSASIFGAGNLENFGAIGVDIFFVISGFIIARTSFIDRKLEAADFVWKRLRRIVPIYWLLTIPWIFVRLREGSLTGDGIVATLFFWPAAGDAVTEPILVLGWSLCFEMLFYAVSAMVLMVDRPVAIVVALAAYMLAWVARVTTGKPTFQFLGNPIVLEFLAGVLIAWVTSGARLQVRGWLVALLGVAALALLLNGLIRGTGAISELQYVLSGNLSLARCRAWGVPAACLVFVVVALEQHGAGFVQTAWLAPWVFLGDASYSIYLIHPLALLAVRYYGNLVHLQQSAELTVIVSMLIACAAGALCYVALERPMLRYLQARSRWRRPAAQASLREG
jgi:exopolysaccharide production protein ExoZ